MLHSIDGGARAACTAALVVIAVACQEPPEVVSLVISNVTVVDPETRRILPDHSVFVSGDRIRAVEPSSSRSRLVAADTLDGAGQFLIPGLIDSHAHLGRSWEAVEVSLSLLIANGVTGVRALGADCWGQPGENELCHQEFRTLGDEIAAGERPGPRLLSLSSSAVNGVSMRDELPDSFPAMFTPGTAEEGGELARYLKQRGVDLIKVYNTVPRAAYFAMLEEASALGLEASGHIPVAVSLVEASDAGQRTIEHARDLPVACSVYSAEYRSRMNDVTQGVDGVTPPPPAERMTKTLEGFDAATCDEVLSTLVSNDTYLVPTHGTREMDARAGEEAYRDDPRLKYVPARLLERWEADLDRTAGARPEVVALYRQFYDAGLRLTGRAHAAGVKVMVGTDANDTMIFPGFGVHDELGRFAEAGIAPLDILRAATTVPAGYFGLDAVLGGVSGGKLADLLLLGADPTADIRNTASINAVVMAGRVYDRAALDELLRRAEGQD